MQRLRAAQHRRQRLQRGADDVVVGLLGRQRHAGRLRVRPQHHAERLLGAEAVLHHPRIDAAGGAELGDLLEEIVVHVPEEAEARREVVHRHAALDAFLDVSESVGEREGQLLHRRRSHFADVVAADRDGIPARHVLRRVLDHVHHDARRRPRSDHPFLLRDVLLQDIILDGPAQFLL